MADESLFQHYRTPEDRKLIAEHWLRTRYNWDTRPEVLERVVADLSELNQVGLAYLYREAGGGERTLVKQLPDDYDPWR